jgi:hypothetical protein
LKNAPKWTMWVGVASFGIALMAAGCKSAPDFTAANAQALIQAKYDQDAPVGVNIRVNDDGMRQGVTAKYWDRSKSYPVKWWADFKLSADGAKAVKLPAGGDTIQWRPDSADDKNYAVTVVSVATNHLKARDVQDPQSESDSTRTVQFNEAVNLDGVPGPLAEIAHDPGNKLSTKRTATFSLDGGAWKLAAVN